MKRVHSPSAALPAGLLAIAEQTLLAEHPKLVADRSAARPDALPTERARRLLRAIRPLRHEITRYRRAVREHLLPMRDDELPF